MNSEKSSQFVYRKSEMYFPTNKRVTPMRHPAGGALLTKDLVLCRGLPGSGKSTIAMALAMVGYRHFEADMFFEVDGRYVYDASRIREAHDWCKRMTREALSRGDNVIVSNTFTRLVEMEPYYAMGAHQVRVIEANGNWESLHGVSREMLERMAARWEKLQPEVNESEIKK